jgi:hypothetical protein
MATVAPMSVIGSHGTDGPMGPMTANLRLDGGVHSRCALTKRVLGCLYFMIGVEMSVNPWLQTKR